MKKIIVISLLLLISLVASSQYRIMSYFRNGAYGDYVIVYGYYDSAGIFRMSHCRTNAIAGDLFANNVYLDINTCQIRPVIIPQDTVAGAIPPPPPPGPAQRAF